MVKNRRLTPFFIRDLEALRVVSDPLRVRILDAASREPVSVKEIAAALKISPGKLYYHVDLLERHGFLVVDSTRLVSGITEKCYRSVSRDIRVDRGVFGPKGLRKAFDDVLNAVFDATRIEAERSLRAGVLAIGEERDSSRTGLLSRSQVRLSPKAAADLLDHLDELIAQAHSDADQRESRPYDLTLAFFPIASGD